MIKYSLVINKDKANYMKVRLSAKRSSSHLNYTSQQNPDTGKNGVQFI